MSEKSWIDINPEVMGGRPCIRDTRVTVDTIGHLAESGYDLEDLLREFPFLNEQDVVAARIYWDRTQGFHGQAKEGAEGRN